MEVSKRKKTNNNSTILFMVVSILIATVFVFSLLYYYNHTIINDGTITDLNPVDYVYQVEAATIENNNLTLSGWCFIRDKDTSEINAQPKMRIAIVDTNNYDNGFHYYSAEYGISRDDVNEYFLGDSECNYSNCGFTAEIDMNELHNDKVDYEVIIQPNIRKAVTIRPGIFIHKGEIMYVNPNIYKPLDVIGTDLEFIVTNGILRAYKPDVGIYIYQYGRQLYYIADETYPFDEGWKGLGCNIATFRSDLLPEANQESGFISNGFIFTDYEITDTIDTGHYRVCVRELPVEFPISFIDTGYWTSKDGWIWLSRFCPGIRMT